MKKSCNITDSHSVFANQCNSSIIYVLKLAIFLEKKRAEKNKTI